MKREMYFIDTAAGTTLNLPVTPKQYAVEHAREIINIDMQTVGQVNLPGLPKLFDRDIECFFPAQAYPFLSAGASTDPQYYIDAITAWIDAGTVLRFVVSGTKINVPVLIGGMRYGEQDGTNDVYATINIREYRQLAVISNTLTGSNTTARASLMAADSTTYVVAGGDTLWSIAQRFYGDGSLAYKLAAYDGISSPSLISVGQVLKIPAAAELESVTAVSASSSGSTGSGSSTKSTVKAAAASAEVKLTVGYKSDFFGVVNLTATSPAGKKVISKLKFTKSGSISMPVNSAVVLTWYAEGGHEWDYAYWAEQKITGSVGQLARVIKTDTAFNVHWVR